MAVAFHNRVRNGFAEIAKNNPDRVKLINVENKTIEDLQKDILNIIDKNLCN